MSAYSRAHARDDSRSELLPSGHSWRKGHDCEIADLSHSTLKGRPKSFGYWMPFLGVLTLFSVFSAVVFIPSHHKWHATASVESFDTTPTNLTEVIPSSNVSEASGMDAVAHGGILELYAGQSRTLEQASARYYLKSGRAPPPKYDKWFAFAQENQCLIDEYDRIHRDFAPFYQLVHDHPEHFETMVDLGREMMLLDPRGMVTICIRDGEVQMPEYKGTSFDPELHVLVHQIAQLLPDMEFFVNGRDEPRVVSNALAPSAQEEAMRLGDLDPFRIAPVPTSELFRKHSGVLRSSSSSGFTTDLWPLLSMAKISPCFSDILFPGPYNYDQSTWSGTFMHTDDIAWENKEPKLYWHPTSNGGHILRRELPLLPAIPLRRPRDCDRDAIVAEYDIGGPVAPKEEIYQFKYLLDVDGNTFSGRYLGLLRSGSLVFKSTAFVEYFSDWLHPYEHCILVHWAIENEAEARAIQERGMQFATRVLTDRHNDFYFAAVLLEWGRLQTLALVGNATINETATISLTNVT
ncbi:hypothetical protein B0H11DRAFT_2251534 [Mycena galericulata]|nr:hypothetical protein B0H11DRAFT_2251534 [Mycena galericulata]